MKFNPTQFHKTYISLFLIFAFIVISCTKDSDLFSDTFLDKQNAAIEERLKLEEEEEEEEEEIVIEEEETVVEEEVIEEVVEENNEPQLESRTSVFYTINDAHVQSGKGYNQEIIRLEENNRISYLMFDLSPIDSISGIISKATLKFTINSDNGNGSITISKGSTNDWDENNISDSNIPAKEWELGSLLKEYKVGSTEEIQLDTHSLNNEKTTIILSHEQGNDLAFASKEHPSNIGPILEITYDVSLGTDSIEIPIIEPVVIVNENNAPIAIADATPSSGGAPLAVEFVGSNSSDDNSISTYVWDFKDGNTSNESNPSHSFTEVGVFQVELTVTDSDGLTDTDLVEITVNELGNTAPVAVITSSVTVGEAPLNVTFNGSGSTDDNAVSSFSWDFKDGSTETNANPTHTFTEVGTYEVELTVQDENGLSNTETITVTVEETSPNQSPVAIAGASTIIGDAPLTVHFTGSESTDDKGVVSYFWNFPIDPSSSANATRTFNSPGVYEITLNVEDEEGLTSSTSLTITVNEPDNPGGSNGTYPSNAVFASSFGFNSSDATNALTSALQSGSDFVVIDKQSSDWIIRPTTLFDLRDMTIMFESGVVLRAKSGAFPNTTDQLIKLVRATNVDIIGYGATFRMNKSEYSSGEHRHALTINKGNNVSVKGLTLRDSGGDGILIAGSENGSYSQNITIEDITSINNRRQGMSIISAQNVWVRNSSFLGTNGTDPESGVDLEPNLPSERLVNINFENCNFEDNDSFGFTIGTNKLNSSSTPIDVSLIDCEFRYNAVSPTSGTARAEINFSQGVTSNPVKGTITFERIKFYGSQRSIIFSKKSADAYDVIFKDCEAYNVASNGGPVIILESLSTEDTVGGFTFDNFYLEYNSNTPFLQIRAPITSGFIVRDISGDFTIKEPYDNPLEYVGGYNPSNNINVNINYQHIN